MIRKSNFLDTRRHECYIGDFLYKGYCIRTATAARDSGNNLKLYN